MDSGNAEFSIASVNPGGEAGMGGGRNRRRYGGKYNVGHIMKGVGNQLKVNVKPAFGGKGTFRRKHKKTRKSRKHRKKTHRRY